MNSTIKNIPIILGALVLTIAIPLSLTVANQKNSVNPSLKAANENPIIYLFPEKINTIQVGQTGTISINLNTKGRVFNGVDITLKYNPLAIKINEAQSEIGTIFKQYPGNIMVDEKEGMLSVSGRGEFKGIGLVAKIGFIPLTTNETTIDQVRINSGTFISDFKGSVIKASN